MKSNSQLYYKYYYACHRLIGDYNKNSFIINVYNLNFDNDTILVDRGGDFVVVHAKNETEIHKYLQEFYKFKHPLYYDKATRLIKFYYLGKSYDFAHVVVKE